jgi:hypothetical protein
MALQAQVALLQQSASASASEVVSCASCCSA